MNTQNTRILIIGFSGSGKSTLAYTLGKYYTCPVLFLDCVHWLPGWKERSLEEKEKIVSEYLADNDCWIMDGNYRSVCFDQRTELATQIIFMNFSRFRCLFRVIKRYLQNRGTTRMSVTDGCLESLNMPFVWWVFHEGRTRQRKKNLAQVGQKYPDKFVTIKNPRQLARYLDQIGTQVDRSLRV